MKENKDITCEPCQENFKQTINELVHDVRKPSAATHERRGEQVRAAFGHHKPEKTHSHGAVAENQAAKPTTKPATNQVAKPTAMPDKKR